MESLSEQLRSAVLYFRYHRDNPHVGMSGATLAGHLVALAEWAARDVGHDVGSASFVAGRVGDPSDKAPGKDDLREGS